MAYPYVALDTAKIHAPITLEFRRDAKPRVFLVRKRRPCGFYSHRPLHFSLPGVSLRCPWTRLSVSPSSHSLDAATTVPLIECVDGPLGRVRSRWSHPSVIDPVAVNGDRQLQRLQTIDPFPKSSVTVAFSLK
jgi:hypothetical protein